MTLLETTYRQLHSAGLVQCAEAFSRDYLGRNSNWYAYNKHRGRDYSVGAAIQCLRYTRTQLHYSDLPKAQRATLQRVELQLATYLIARYCVAEVC